MTTADNPFSLKILIAEDNPVNQTLILLMLKQLGYPATLVQNGVEALEAFRHSFYKLVLMDIQMPQMDGLTATRQIRQMQVSPPCIIAMTANCTPSDLRSYTMAGMDGHLAKPIQIAELKRLLETCAATTRTAVPIADACPSFIEQQSEAVCLDRRMLDTLCRDLGLYSPGALNSLIDCYLTEAPHQIAALQQAVGQQDAVELNRIAHTLKSSSRTLGGMQLAQRCQQLEEWGRLGILGPVAAALTELEQEFERFRAALEQERQ